MGKDTSLHLTLKFVQLFLVALVMKTWYIRLFHDQSISFRCGIDLFQQIIHVDIFIQ